MSCHILRHLRRQASFEIDVGSTGNLLNLTLTRWCIGQRGAAIVGVHGCWYEEERVVRKPICGILLRARLVAKLLTLVDEDAGVVRSVKAVYA